MKWTRFRIEKVEGGYLVSVYLDFVVNKEEPDFKIAACAGYQENHKFSTVGEVKEFLVDKFNTMVEVVEETGKGRYHR